MPAKPHTGTSLPFSAYRTAEVRTRQLESLGPLASAVGGKRCGPSYRYPAFPSVMYVL